MVVRPFLVALFLCVPAAAVPAEQPASPIVIPRAHSIVGSRVNLVLDPTEVQFFQVIVGKTEYPVVDTSTGRHAYQGLELEPGLNTITLKVFAPPDERTAEKSAAPTGIPEKGPAAGPESGTKGLTLVATWTRQVFSKVELRTRKPAPAGFQREPFHTRERETGCAGCHNLEAPPRDATPPQKPEDMICYVCHQKIPTGRHIHGPAAVWSCLACHDPDAQPVKYQFAVDPSHSDKRSRTVAETCKTCHPDILADPFRHGPAEAGYCTVCHDPHASKYPAWTRKSSRRLCTTCHAEKKTGAHVVAGVGSGLSHPTKKKADPARPGKRLSCVSCHTPHSARTRELLAFDVREKSEICEYCHHRK